MNIKKIHSVLFTDIWRSMLIALRYVIGAGEAQKIKLNKKRVSAVPIRNMQTCVGCKLCMRLCPAEAIKVNTMFYNDRSSVDFKLSGEHCVACGLCVEACPQKALSFEKEKVNVRD